MEFDTTKLMKDVMWSEIEGDYVKIKVDGEQLRKNLYEEIHITIEDNDTYITLQSGYHDLIDITPGSVFNKGDCLKIATEMKNILNNCIRAQLEMD